MDMENFFPEAVYKIESGGLYSRGGQAGHLNKRGKTWSSYRALRRHLAQFVGGYPDFNIKNPYPENACVIGLRLDCEPVPALSVQEHLEDLRQRRIDERDKEQKRRDKEREDHLASCPYKTSAEARGEEEQRGSYISFPNAPCRYWHRYH